MWEDNLFVLFIKNPTARSISTFGTIESIGVGPFIAIVLFEGGFAFWAFVFHVGIYYQLYICQVFWDIYCVWS
jgi:hypothetical protein